ncbi:hypothetical protein OH738_39580 [Streptomyces hirsutus]|uniref:Uncharacterized protein n=1 Tax=Streptomyces hirsutus TaxID=35620 RepID=A0ABZ1GE08_9ACTN|nr:hypothetical protein [Streptomyces hirsutus]WSD04380.1 hypothetical protein OIE73_00365 [Streptomyces hirsutus]WTD22230.1 hypothetical protein OH738_39580 [Streptomyces hirsutus]WTD72696.1 hypothetical protein OHB56_00905 [Streptomyces sp. NBC_01635]
MQRDDRTPVPREMLNPCGREKEESCHVEELAPDEPDDTSTNDATCNRPKRRWLSLKNSYRTTSRVTGPIFSTLTVVNYFFPNFRDAIIEFLKICMHFVLEII